METVQATKITVETVVNAPVEAVWKCWTTPEDIVHWNAASEDWHTTNAKNDLRAGGEFSSRMEAKDGSMGFDFGGTYETVNQYELIVYRLGDGRKVEVIFEPRGSQTHIVETFDAEHENSIERQRDGWQAILDNFKSYV
ncbi:MAG TPA: SRPBCC family protein, partial [Bacteroidota bacterium]|nr:SRPBCC family protein [Bacteroidota bacterium]